ncbi:replication protein A 70 kDa DNA-binding subunit D-like [Solanum lycopersicum]|uniref:replication protein A 70 kDa DNA-binding subunit D-like n=1 Tax=Solanum lycopersicum TaxID=4081 RepID=UPI00374A07B1
MTISFLSELVTGTDDFTIRGNLMRGIIRKNQVNRFKDKLNEGSNLSEDIVEIPVNGFEFINPDVIDSRVNNNIVLSDIVSCLYGIGDIESVGSKWKKRDIYILTDYLAKAKITLWEEFGEKFCPYLYNNDAGPYIVIVTSTTVKEFRGEVSFSTTYASKIYVNLDIDYIRSLAPKFSTMSNEVQIIKSSNVNSLPREEEMFLNRMDIKELLEAEWSSELQEYIVTVKSKIIEIHNYFGWYYISCNVCSKKIEPTNSIYRCHNFNKDCKFPLVRYKIHLKVTDRTGDTTFILFNPVAEKLLDTSAHKLFNKLTTANNDVPVQVQSLCGKEFFFN